MSLFFRPSSSESESDESDDAPVAKQKARRWIESSDEEEDEKRVVRSAKDKRWTAMQTITKDIKNHTKIQDFVSMLADFEKLVKEFGKAQTVISTEGLPVFYLRAIVRLEDTVNSVTSEAKKKMNSNNNKSYTKLKTQLKKQNADIEDKLTLFRKNPVASEESQEEESEVKKGQEDEEGEEEWVEEDSSSSDEDDRDYDPNNPRAYWTIKESRDKDEPSAPKVKVPKPKPKPKVDADVVVEQAIVYTPALIETKLKEIAESRGKKSVNLTDIHDILIEMLQNAQSPALRVEILLQLIPTIFDLSRNMPTIVMPRETWNSAVQKLREFLDSYRNHPDLFAGSFEHRFQALKVGLSHFNERLNEELKKALRHCEPHTNEYADRLRDSHVLNSLVHLSCVFFREQSDGPNEARMALLLLELSYYVHDNVSAVMRSRYDGPETCLFFQIQDSQTEVGRLAQVVQTHGDEKAKAQAALMHSYHHALHFRFQEAKTLFESVPSPEAFSADPMSQALYNRSLVQLGVSAFSTGMLQDAFLYLNDIVSTRRLRELLAHVASGSKEKSQQQDREEKRRMVPYHMHINEDMVESMYLISALIIDLPKMAANPLDAHKVISSKALKKLLEQQERQGYFGPPESTKDFITSACASLKSGDWEAAWSTLQALDFWKFLPDWERVQQTILEKVKEVALVVYILTYAEYYTSFSRVQLATIFGLPEAQVFALISGLIYEKHLNAYWDGDSVLLDSASFSRMHYLAVQLASKTTQVLEVNEKLLEYRGAASQLLGERS